MHPFGTGAAGAASSLGAAVLVGMMDGFTSGQTPAGAGAQVGDLGIAAISPGAFTPTSGSGNPWTQLAPVSYKTMEAADLPALVGGNSGLPVAVFFFRNAKALAFLAHDEKVSGADRTVPGGSPSPRNVGLFGVSRARLPSGSFSAGAIRSFARLNNLPGQGSQGYSWSGEAYYRLSATDPYSGGPFIWTGFGGNPPAGYREYLDVFELLGA